jgi:hypothetical protein
VRHSVDLGFFVAVMTLSVFPPVLDCSGPCRDDCRVNPIAEWKYRVQLPGFELPEAIAMEQRELKSDSLNRSTRSLRGSEDDSRA